MGPMVMSPPQSPRGLMPKGGSLELPNPRTLPPPPSKRMAASIDVLRPATRQLVMSPPLTPPIQQGPPPTTGHLSPPVQHGPPPTTGGSIELPPGTMSPQPGGHILFTP